MATTEQKQPTLSDAEAKLKQVKAQLAQFEGKPKMNPFLWAKEHKLSALEKRLADKDLSVIPEIMSLPNSITPSVNLEKPLFTD